MIKLERAKILVKRLKKISDLKRHGFQFIPRYDLKSEPSSEGIYINRESKIVIKRNYLLGSKPVKYTVPTVETNCPEGFTVLIQHLCKPLAFKNSSERKKFRAFQTLAGELNADFHSGNVMWMGNRLVMVDW